MALTEFFKWYGISIPYLTSQLKCIRPFFINHGITHALTDLTESKPRNICYNRILKTGKHHVSFFPPPCSPSIVKYHSYTQTVFPKSFLGFRLYQRRKFPKYTEIYWKLNLNLKTIHLLSILILNFLHLKYWQMF